MKNIISFIGGVVKFVLILLIIFASLVSLLSRSQGLFNCRVFVLSSGSMGPAMPYNSLVLIKPQTSYQKNDVITFYTNDSGGQRQSLPTTHRLVDIKTGDNLGFVTRGDANNTPDPFITPASSVIGKVIFHLPYFGAFIDFIQSRDGFTYFVVIPVTILVYQELLNLKTEIGKIIAKRQLAQIK